MPEECRGSARSSPDPDAGSDGLGPLPRLVDLVVGSDDAPRFIAAAAEALGEPLGVVAVTGQALGYAPDAQGRRAPAVAAAAPDAADRPARLTGHLHHARWVCAGVNCPAGERVRGRPAYREAVELLRRTGATGAIVLRGVSAARAGRDVWQTIRVYTRPRPRSAATRVYSELTRRLRAARAAGATTILGEWGFSSDEVPHGNKLGRVVSHQPSYTVYIDRCPLGPWSCLIGRSPSSSCSPPPPRHTLAGHPRLPR